MITVTITAPTTAEAMKFARQVQALYASSGKVVRVFEGEPIEHTISRADVTIIAKQENPHV